MGFIILFGFLFLATLGYSIYEWRFNKITYNSLIARHPDNGGGSYFKQLPPQKDHHPWYYRYKWFHLKWNPIWVWEEKKSETGNPEFIYGIVPYEPSSPVTLTSEALYSDVDWDDAKDYMSCQSKWMEGIKFGMAVLMVLACIFGLMIMVDMLGK